MSNVKVTNISNQQPQDLTQNVQQKPTSQSKYTWESERKRDRTPVKGIFKYHEVPNGVLRFSYKAYEGDPVENFEFYDGRIYTIPLGVAKHLNKNGFYPHYQYQFDKYGIPIQCIEKKIRRFNFNSLEFMPEDDAGNNPDLLTVKQIQAMGL